MGKHANGWERKRPEGWKPPFHYSYHNRAFVERALMLYHGAAEAKAAEYEAKTGVKILVWPLDKALKSARKRYAKFCGNTSKYVPHQGERERERRIAFNLLIGDNTDG